MHSLISLTVHPFGEISMFGSIINVIISTYCTHALKRRGGHFGIYIQVILLDHMLVNTVHQLGEYEGIHIFHQLVHQKPIPNIKFTRNPIQYGWVRGPCPSLEAVVPKLWTQNDGDSVDEEKATGHSHTKEIEP